MFYNLGERKPGEMSAYSMFNPGYEALPGQLRSEQFAAELRGGAGAVARGQSPEAEREAAEERERLLAAQEERFVATQSLTRLKSVLLVAGRAMRIPGVACVVSHPVSLDM